MSDVMVLSPLRTWPIYLRSCPPPACGRLLLDFAASDGPGPALRSEWKRRL